MKRDKIIIGTRGSKLALIYAEKVTKFLKKVSSTHIEIKKIEHNFISQIVFRAYLHTKSSTETSTRSDGMGCFGSSLKMHFTSSSSISKD